MPRTNALLPVSLLAFGGALLFGCESIPEFSGSGDELSRSGMGGASMGGAGSGRSNLGVTTGDGTGGDGTGGPGSNVSVPCADTVCTAGQRCEEDTCIDNTCDDLECGDKEICEPHPGGGNVCADNSCTSDVQCDSDSHCGGDGECVTDACTQSTTSCDGTTLLACSSNGASETPFSCVSEAYFSASCEDSSGVAACTCEDDWDCPAFMECEVGVCVGTGVAPTCTLPPTPFDETLPDVEIFWGGESRTNDDAKDGNGDDVVWPAHSHVIGTPAVANLDDDNGDGLINELDFPEILFIGYKRSGNSSDDWRHDGVVRVVHGGGANKGKDYFARCGDKLWQSEAILGTTPSAPEACANANGNSAGDGDAVGGSAIAVGDLDYDGVPEIVYTREDDRLRILDNEGNSLLVTPSNTWSTDQNAENVSIANLDYDGLAELIVGRTVIKLGKDDDGDFFVDRILEGDKSIGLNNFGPMSCVADISSDPGQEIAAGVSLYRLPASIPDCVAPPCTDVDLEVVWHAPDETVNIDGGKVPSQTEGFCAVANIWGADFTARPGPTNHPDDDGKPEVVVIANGRLVILAGETGEVIYDEPVGSGDRGGAPNIDDFDGDGFMEVATALQNYYSVIDLQEPTVDCPEWPLVLTRAVGDNGDATTYNPNLPASPRAANCLHNGWRRDSDDNSSKATSSSVFDFNGDGAAEVIYNDECNFRIYDGLSGAVLYTDISRSRTAIENPIVADVDNDGNAEVVTVLNTESIDRCDDDPDDDTLGPNGIRVWGDPTDQWVSARRIWNQGSYHVTNVSEDGGIPLHPPESWGTFNGRTYNTYRSQPRNFGVAPDLAVLGVGVSSPDAQCGQLSSKLDISFQIENLGDLRVGPGVEVTFVGVWGTDEIVLVDDAGDPIVYTIQSSLEPGGSLIDSVDYDVDDQPGQSELPDRVRVSVDTGGEDTSDFGAERECNEDNNDGETAVDAGSERPDLTVEAGAVVVNCGSQTGTVEVEVENVGTATASEIVVAIYAGDPSQGGLLIGTETLSGTLAAGAKTNSTINLTGFAPQGSTQLWAVVDPADQVEECNDANNREPADNTVGCGVVVQ